jgi:hypothetical protein
MSTVILTHNPETVALCHTLSHFSALFSRLPLTVCIIAHGREIYLTLFYTTDLYSNITEYGSALVLFRYSVRVSPTE